MSPCRLILVGIFFLLLSIIFQNSFSQNNSIETFSLILLLGVTFSLLVYRLSVSNPISLKYAKLPGVVVAVAILSLVTMPITIDNSFWGYASTVEPEMNIPKPIDFLYFDIGNNHLSHGAIIIQDKENSAISLDGDGDYLVIDSNLPEKLHEFSVSTWIKPFYKKGSPATLSIVSEANAFDLSIINNKVDKNLAIFSIYDGIKWHKIQSKSVISESWTHLSATYSGNEIKIFVNGIQENSRTINGDYSFTHQYGETTQNSYEYISSKSNILVGAFNPSIRDNASVQNNFSGLIDDVTLYDQLLSSDHISTLEENNRTPNFVPEPKVQSIETEPEQTGTKNEYGFVTDDDNPDDQKIEEVAAEGYKVKKPEDKEKKDKDTPENQSSENTDTVIEETFSDKVVILQSSSTQSNQTVVQQIDVVETFSEDVSVLQSSFSQTNQTHTQQIDFVEDLSIQILQALEETFNQSVTLAQTLSTSVITPIEETYTLN
jgi:hypothetical protein